MPVDRNANTGTFILLSGALLALALAASCLAGLWVLHRDELAEGRKNLQRLSRVLAEQTALAFQEIDSILKEVRPFLTPESLQETSQEDLHRRLRHRFHGLLQGQALLVFGPDGRMLVHSREFPTPNVTVSDREYFRAHREKADDDLYISRPLQNRVNNNWMISLSRRLPGPDNGFGGVVMAAIELDYFIRLYRSLDLPPQARISLQRADGIVLATYPFDAATLGTPQPACLDVQETIRADSQVSGLPLTLCLSVPQAMVLRRWTALAWMIAPAVLAAVVGIGFLTGALMHRVRRERLQAELQQRSLEEQVGKRTTELKDALDLNEKILAASPAGIAVYRQDGQCVSANAVFCRITGGDMEELSARPLDSLPFWRESDLREQARQTFETGGATHQESHVITDSGQEMWIDWQFVRFVRNNIFHLLLLFSDITERKRVENALGESETRFRMLFEMSPEAMLVFEEDRFIDCNASALAMIGVRDKSAIIGTTPAGLSPLVQPDGRPSDVKAQDMVRLAYANGSTCFEWEHVRASGEHFLAEVALTTIFHRERKLLHVVWHDITEQKLTAALLNARMRLNTLAGTCSVDEIMRISLDEAEALTGSTIGFFHFLEADQVTLRLQAWSSNTLNTICTAKGRGQHYPVEEAGVWADAVRERRPIIHNDYPNLPNRKGLPEGHAPILRELVVPVIRNERIEAIVGVGNKPRDYTGKDVEILTTFAVAASDIVLRKRAEEELRRMEALLKSMLLNLPLDFWARDFNQDLIIQSEISRRIWGDLEATGPDVASVPEAITTRWRENNTRAFAGEVVQDEQVYTLPSGDTVYLQELIAPIRRDGAIIGIMGVNVDLTPCRLLEKELRASKESAEAANRSKSEFLANMSHEIRTPLNGILGMLQLMETTALDLEQKEYLLAALASSRRLTRLLSDILDLSRIEAGKLIFHEAAFEVKDLKGSIMEVFRLVAGQKGLDLDFVIDKRIAPRLIGDEARLRQILFNLVGNAVKFTAKGHVWVEAVPLPTTREGICQVLFSVDDTGIGIPDARLADIFEPFVQGGEAEVQSHQGAGLGLSIVRRLVRLMGGELAIDNRQGEGTTFYVSLPLRLPVAVGPQAQAPGPGIPQKDVRYRILLAEDEQVNLLAVKRVLEKSGHTVIPAGNGREVLQLLEGQTFDCILMDIQMPLMDGLQASRAIREAEDREGQTHIPIVAMTAYAMTGDRERFLAAGMDDYLSKPVEMDALMRIIGRVMSVHRGEPSQEGRLA